MQIESTVTWSGPTDPRGQYSRKHEWAFDGGARISASSSPDVVPVPASDPTLVDPEEAVLAALSSCHMMFFLHLAQATGWVVGTYEDSAIAWMEKSAEIRTLHIARATLKPRIRFVGDAPEFSELEALHQKAHQQCFIANSLRTEVTIEPISSEEAIGMVI